MYKINGRRISTVSSLVVIQTKWLHWSIYTYKHNWPFQPFSMDYDQAFHTPHVVYVNFIHEWRDLQFNAGSEWKIFEKHFKAGCCQKFAVKGNCRKNIFFFHISFWCLTWYTKPGFTFNKPTHYLCTRLRQHQLK